MPNPDDYLERARQYWRHAPGGGGKVDTVRLLEASDEEFLRIWDEARRGKRLTYWEEEDFLRYFASRARDRDVFSFGCGLGYSELDLLKANARVTFADIVPSTISCVERLCSLRGHADRSRFMLMDDSADVGFGGPYDFVFAYGSLMHMPEERQAAVLESMFDALRPGGAIWLMLYTPRFVQSVGSAFSQEEFGRASDPSVGELDNPWSDWHDDEKLLRLAGHQACILNREEFNEGRYVWYGLGRRDEHGSTSAELFVDLPSIEAARSAEESRTAHFVAEVLLAQAVEKEATASYRVDGGLDISTTPNNFHYAVEFPEIGLGGTIPARLLFDAFVERGGFAIGLLDIEMNRFFYNCVVWRDGMVRGSRDLGTVEWPDRFRVVVSNYQPGTPAASEWRLDRIAFYKTSED